MRGQSTRAQSIYIFLQTNKFKRGKQHNKGIVIGLNTPCSDTAQIIKLSTTAVDMIYRSGYLYQKAGIMLLDLLLILADILELKLLRLLQHKKKGIFFYLMVLTLFYRLIKVLKTMSKR